MILVGIVFVLFTCIVALHAAAYLPLFAALLACVCLALQRGFSLRAVAHMAWDGIGKAVVPIEMLSLIGVLMGLWRLNGTAATVAAYGSALISPRHLALSAFVLCAVVSMAVGTANGAASIIGLPLMMAGHARHFPQGLLAGAIISGVYLGDRSSLVSSVLHMASRLTGTSASTLFRRLLVTLAPALVASAFLYSVTTPPVTPDAAFHVASRVASRAEKGSIEGELDLAGVAGGIAEMTAPESAPAPDPPLVPDLHRGDGSLSPALLLVPGFMLVMAVFGVHILANLALNVVLAVVVAQVARHAPPDEIVRAALFGCRAMGGPSAAPVAAGGGFVSMIGVLLVLISSTALSGVLLGTRIFDAALGRWLSRLACPRKVLLATMGFSVATGMVAANQALSVVLPCTLLKRVYQERRMSGLALAHAVSDSGVIAAPLVPWSVAALGPAAILGVTPGAYIPYAFFCWLLPVAFAVWALSRPASCAKCGESGQGFHGDAAREGNSV
ncbi:MAG: hypothetical protein NUW12_00990 [Firmicutes bacterium]|nr:hypothetical protein [Bacillota bacterium]MDH7494523.1 Na+/H+ antiporter NhaC family protein [Bacillota bacterium]